LYGKNEKTKKAILGIFYLNTEIFGRPLVYLALLMWRPWHQAANTYVWHIMCLEIFCDNGTFVIIEKMFQTIIGDIESWKRGQILYPAPSPYATIFIYEQNIQ